MSQRTDKVFRRLNAYLDEHGDEIKNEKDYEAHINKFMQLYNKHLKNGDVQLGPETSDDYLELAEEATSQKKRIEYAKKSLELDSNNLDAAHIIIDETIKDPLIALDKYKKLIEKGGKILEKDGFFKEFKGEFWLAFETRPYMRVRYDYMCLLADCGMIKLAAKECEEMLELCRGDNLGVRYNLMHIYAFLEDEVSAKKLYNKYSEISTHFLLPYSILCYKLGNLKQSATILKDLAAQNKDTKKFFKAICSKDFTSLDKLMSEMSPYGELHNSIDEYIGEMMNYGYLITSVPHYFKWGKQILK